jgi:tungstate transport system substrate-binding protein
MPSLRKPTFALIAVFCSAVFLAGHTLAQEKSIVVASTTSTKDSGLFEYLMPLFKLKTGITVKVRAVGLGAATLTLSLHISKSAEQTFVAEGHGVKRYPVMYNDFVLIGPEGDPAGIRGMKDVAKALKAIKDKSATFISRGDNSGTHMRELMLWNKDVGINIQELDGPWYKPIERGMNAHAPYSTRPPAAMHSPTAALGFLSKTRATFKSWWKATDACSISTPSFW